LVAATTIDKSAKIKSKINIGNVRYHLPRYQSTCFSETCPAVKSPDSNKSIRKKGGTILEVPTRLRRKLRRNFLPKQKECNENFFLFKEVHNWRHEVSAKF
jgi:hypothetical protein